METARLALGGRPAQAELTTNPPAKRGKRREMVIRAKSKAQLGSHMSGHGK